MIVENSWQATLIVHTFSRMIKLGSANIKHYCYTSMGGCVFMAYKLVASLENIRGGHETIRS